MNNNLIGQKNNKQPSFNNGMMYDCSVSESCYESSSILSPTVIKLDEVDNKDNSEGKEKALAAGCNANNSNASACSANCNNAVSNDNSNFAWAFAVKKIETSRNQEVCELLCKKIRN